jgi:hypothetical protein
LLRRREGKGGKGWDGMERGGKGRERRGGMGKRAGGKYCFMAVGGGWTPLSFSHYETLSKSKSTFLSKNFVNRN